MSIDQREFRNALGTFATGITVMTTTSPSGDPVGVTINSFASVSLEPPLVLFSLKTESELVDVFKASGTYTVNILAADQENLSNLFAGPGENKFDDIEWHTGENGAPVLDGTLATLECEIAEFIPGGDHVILLGKVTSLNISEKEAALLYYKGGYKSI